MSGRAGMVVVVVIAIAVAAGGMFLISRGVGGGARSGGGGLTQADERAERRAFVATMALPEFELTDQDGARATKDLFSGHRTALVFTFTHCPAACPSMMSRLVPLYFETGGAGSGASEARFVSITVDPEHDTRAALKAHAASLGVDGPRWRFLTGDAATIKRIIESLRFALVEDTLPIALADGSTMPNIIHPTKAVLIGEDGRVMDFFDALSDEGVGELKRALAAPVEGK